MLSWFKRSGDSSARVNEQLAELERDARTSDDQSMGHMYNRCGDLSAGSGQTPRAVRYYGLAVDAYLRAGFAGPAAAMCRKILRLAPNSVRTHCTLACLAAHEGHLAEARREIDRFVEASERSHTERLAIGRLRLVGIAISDDALRRHVADRLTDMGDPLGSDRIKAAIEEDHHHPEGLGPNAWERLMKAAAADPDDLWKYA